MTIEPAVKTALQQFEQGSRSFPGTWLHQIRGQALADFAARGLPSRRMEAWKYTNLSRLAGIGFELPSAVPVDPAVWREFAVEGACRIVITNGRYDARASSVPKPGSGIHLLALSEAVEHHRELVRDFLRGDDPPLVSLNTAFMQDGLVLHVADGMELDKPVQVLHVVSGTSQPVAVHPRTLVSLGKGSRASVVETFIGDGPGRSWTNGVTELRAAVGSELLHARLQAEATGAYHTSTTRVSLEGDARYMSFAITSGATLSRSEMEIACTGSGASCDIRGGLLLHGRQHGDNTTRVDHRVSGTTSRQVFRNVLDDAARSVFQGRIDVRPVAQQTDSGQSCRSLLLSDTARADTKPELRILADDVKCSHGATVGNLDHDALFYLQSRGIPHEQARALLIEAFVAEVIADVPGKEVQSHLAAAVSAWATGGGTP